MSLRKSEADGAVVKLRPLPPTPRGRAGGRLACSVTGEADKRGQARLRRVTYTITGTRPPVVS